MAAMISNISTNYMVPFCLVPNWYSNLPIGMFPKIVVPPNHPFYIIGFSIINHPFWGTPIYGNTHRIQVWYILGSRHAKNQWHEASFLPFTQTVDETSTSDSYIYQNFKPHIGKYIPHMDPMGWKPKKKTSCRANQKKHDMFC